MRIHRWLRTLLFIPLLAGCECCDMRCVSHSCSPRVPHPSPMGQSPVAEIEYTDVNRCGLTGRLNTLPPRRLSDGIPTDFRELPLDEAIRIGLENSDILRDLGGRVVETPGGVASVFDPSIVMSNPRVGEEAALAAFDAQFAQAATYIDGRNVFNNVALGGGATEVNRDLFRLQNQISKTAATGTQMALRTLTESEHNDAPFNLFSHAWTGTVEASVRQPLLQGSGVLFNRIIGPRSNVDLALTRGVLLARIDGDISLANFERGVRDYVNQVETAYWQLYFSYRALDANQRARDLARDTWQSVKARYDNDLRGGEADVEAQSREQLFQFEQQVVTSLNGVGDGGGNGVYEAERRLRRMMGLPMNDGQLIRPSDEPIEIPIRFDWDGCLAESLTRRVELRQQSWRVRQRELELLAAKNFLLPRLDAVASYRLSGLGDDLLGGAGPNSSLGRELFSFNNDEFELGMQLNVPLGYRRELAGVRHSELNLCRERAILRDQEHQISLDLAQAFGRLETTFESIRLAYNRFIAAEEVVKSRKAVFDAGQSNIEDLLQAQRRLADAQINYYQARISHALALTSLHREKGTLLAYNGVHLSEGGWTNAAYRELPKELFRHRDSLHDYRTMVLPVSRGRFRDALENPALDALVPDGPHRGGDSGGTETEMATEAEEKLIEHLPIAPPAELPSIEDSPPESSPPIDGRSPESLPVPGAFPAEPLPETYQSLPKRESPVVPVSATLPIIPAAPVVMERLPIAPD